MVCNHHVVEVCGAGTNTGQTTTMEGRATLLLIWETLSLAIFLHFIDGEDCSGGERPATLLAEVVLGQSHALWNVEGINEDSISPKWDDGHALWNVEGINEDSPKWDDCCNQHLGFPPSAVHENPMELEEVCIIKHPTTLTASNLGILSHNGP